jgi:hypothetical protein
MHKIHTPSFVRANRHRSWPTVECHVLAPTHAHAELQTVEAIEAANPFAVDEPALAPQ